MPKKTKPPVEKQRLRDREQRTKYGEWTHLHPGPNGGSDNELPVANPDVLPESAGSFYERGPNVKRCMQVMDDAVEALTGRQREAYIGYYRAYKTETQIGHEMGISQSAVFQLLQRAMDNIVDYCSAHKVKFTNGGSI